MDILNTYTVLYFQKALYFKDALNIVSCKNVSGTESDISVFVKVSMGFFLFLLDSLRFNNHTQSIIKK